MKLIHLVPGTGNFHCGATLRDLTLTRALEEGGHRVRLIPLYLPLVHDFEGEAEPRECLPLQLPAVRLYLQTRLPRGAALWNALANWLDAKVVLRLASHGAGMTRASELGAMTLACLEGAEGPQSAAWRSLGELVAIEALRGPGREEDGGGIAAEGAPVVVSLSNSLLSGFVPVLQKALDAPVVVSLQGEEMFLDALPDGYRDRCWDRIRENLIGCRLIAASEASAEDWRERLGSNLADQIRVVPNGVDTEVFCPETRSGGRERIGRSPLIGYLARLTHGKGISDLIDAFVHFQEHEIGRTARLLIVGAMTPSDRPLVSRLKRRLQDAGLAERVEWRTNVSLDEKIACLRRMDLLSVPVRYPESCGLYTLEAMACGTPVVQPNYGAFTECIDLSGAGWSYPAEEGARGLSEGWRLALRDRHELERRGAVGREAARSRWGMGVMAKAFVDGL